MRRAAPTRPRLSIRALAAALLCVHSCLQAAAAAETEPPDALPAVDSSPVTIDGVELFRLVGAASLPSARRAADVHTRIIDVARDRAIGVDTLTVVPREARFDVMAGERHVVSVVDADARFEGAPAAVVAAVRAARIREAIATYRAERTPEYLARATAAAMLATVIALLALVVVLRSVRALRRSLDRGFHDHIHSLKISSFEVVRAETIWRTVSGIVGALRVVLIAAIVYAYLAFTLHQFPWTRGAAGHLLRFVLDPVVTMAKALLGYLPKLIFLIVLFLIVRYALRLTNLLSHAIAAGRVPLRGFDADWALPTYNIVRALIILLAIVVAYPYLPGSGSPAFQGLSIFAGLMLSLGASSAMASLIAGYTVTYRRAFRVGDRVTIGDLTGLVTEIRLLVTHLRTTKNEEIVVPNSVILQSHVINYTKLAQTSGLILHTTVGIGYETPWRQVEAILLTAAARTSGPLQDPPPFVLVKALGDFAVSYEINVYVDGSRDILQTYTALHRNILDAFNEHDVQIMTPAYECDPAQAKIVPKDRWFAAPAQPPDDIPPPPTARQS